MPVDLSGIQLEHMDRWQEFLKEPVVTPASMGSFDYAAALLRAAASQDDKCFAAEQKKGRDQSMVPALSWLVARIKIVRKCRTSDHRHRTAKG